MNLVGKIFIVLILLMSLTFMGFAVAVYATHQSWERIVNRSSSELTSGEPLGLKFQLEEARTKRAQLEAQLASLEQQLQAEQAARQKRLGDLQTEKEELRRENEALVNDKARLVQSEREAVAALASEHQTLEKMRGEVETLRADIRTAQQERDDKFKEFVKLDDDFNQATGELNRLKNQNIRLAEQIAAQRKVANDLRVNLNSPTGKVAADGVVLATGKDGLVEISLGSDDGLKAGHELDVKRGARYLGRITVVETKPDKSVARVLPEFRKGPIEKNDLVATRID